MKVYNRNDARKVAPTHLFDKEEELGISYNWILANYFSLGRYIKNNKITNDQLWSKKVICKPIIIESKSKVASRESKFERLNKSSIVILKEDSQAEFEFVDRELCAVPLIVLFAFGFSMKKELILDTRIYDESHGESSSSSVKKAMMGRNYTLVDSDIESKIESCLMCKSAAFLIPQANADGTAVEWYVPLSENEDVNKRNAIAQHIESAGVERFENLDVLSQQDMQIIINKAKAKK